MPTIETLMAQVHRTRRRSANFDVVWSNHTPRLRWPPNRGGPAGPDVGTGGERLSPDGSVPMLRFQRIALGFRLFA